MKAKKCMECEREDIELFEMLGTIACENCWEEYWRDEQLGYDSSWMEFKMGLKKVK